MATIRVGNWTKEKLYSIQEKESHSSHDSVIKPLLKDHELAQFATAMEDEVRTDESPGPPRTAVSTNSKRRDLSLVSEPRQRGGPSVRRKPDPDPRLRDEVPDLPHASRPPRDRGHRDRYPIEQRVNENTLEDDLKACIVDYWDRTLETMAASSIDVEADIAKLIWQFGEYVRTFDWQWPVDIAVVGVEVGRTYRDDPTAERLEILKRVSENRKNSTRTGLNEPPMAPPTSRFSTGPSSCRCCCIAICISRLSDRSLVDGTPEPGLGAFGRQSVPGTLGESSRIGDSFYPSIIYTPRL